MKKLNLVLSFLLAMIISFIGGVYAAPSIQLGGNVKQADSPLNVDPESAGNKVDRAESSESNPVTEASGNNPSETSKDSNDLSGSESATVVSTGGEIGTPITFNYSINSAEGIKVTWEGKNLTGKTINYYTAELSTYNRVGDPSHDEFTGDSNFSLKYVGPIEPDEDMILFDLFTYQGALHKIKIDKFILEYSDGTTETIDYGYETTDDSGLD
ncbi:hypothetical protein DFP94_1011402 [Fontibacillus phaseoli]|uniref:Uncharacterized protein n=1 Tax=Fontibacillus phaseoli TaxID=1416533 RepID=A0A369BQ86_9BACL|nr:hypothetical protein [Fontibacillus phaseoli]RCX23800.1 hypothetical protein DFP94_1011402 [Fontibacillus phaseoli]